MTGGFDPLEQFEQDAVGAAKPKRKRRKGTVIVLLAFALVVVGAGITATVYAGSLVHSFDTKRQALPDTQVFPEAKSRPSKGAADKSVNVLLLGSDTREDTSTGEESKTASGRSDSMMLVHIPADRHNITVTSILRDTWVSIPGHGKAKINAAFSYGGIPLTVKTVETLLDARIDHVVTIDFQGFTDLVDALGGIDLTVPVPFNRYGHVFKGRMHMDGDTALNFAQERYGFKDGDYQRVRDQQPLLKTIMDKSLSKATLTNPTTVSNVIGAFSPYVGVDDSLTGTKLAELVFSLRKVRGDKVHFFTLPTAGTSWSPDHK